MQDEARDDTRAYLVARAARSRLARTMGYRLAYQGEVAVLTQPYNEALDNGVGAIHGGIVATLVDIAAWYAAAPHYPGWIATVELQTRYLLPAQATELRVEARVGRAGARVAVVDARVTRGDGALIATGAATFLATTRALDEGGGAPDRA